MARPPLTDLESACLRHAASDLHAREIATEMMISETAVKQALRRVRQKLGVRTTGAAIASAIHKGLIIISLCLAMAMLGSILNLLAGWLSL